MEHGHRQRPRAPLQCISFTCSRVTALELTGLDKDLEKVHYNSRFRLPLRNDSVPAPPSDASHVRKVDVRLPGASPVHQIITMIKWIRTSRLSTKNSLWPPVERGTKEGGPPRRRGSRFYGVQREFFKVLRGTRKSSLSTTYWSESTT